MKYVIDLDEDEYELFKAYAETKSEDYPIIRKAFKSSTPLEKIISDIDRLIECELIPDDMSGKIDNTTRAYQNEQNKAYKRVISLINRYATSLQEKSNEDNLDIEL